MAVSRWLTNNSNDGAPISHTLEAPDQWHKVHLYEQADCGIVDIGIESPRGEQRFTNNPHGVRQSVTIPDHSVLAQVMAQEQAGIGLVDLQVGIIAAGTHEVRWLGWILGNDRQDLRGPVGQPDGATQAIGFEIWNQDGIGVIDLRVIWANEEPGRPPIG